MEWKVTIGLAIITMIQSLVGELLRRRGQSKNLTCAACGSTAWFTHRHARIKGLNEHKNGVGPQTAAHDHDSESEPPTSK